MNEMRWIVATSLKYRYLVVFVAAALATVLVAGCSGPGLGPPTPDWLDATAIPAGQAESPWPPSLMTHRAILSIDGSEIPLDGRLAVGKNGALRLVALGAMGRVVFDLLAEPGSAPRVLRSVSAFPAAWARDFAGRDIDTVFRARPATCRIDADGPRARLVAPDGTWIRHFTAGRRGSGARRPLTWLRIEGVRGGVVDGLCVYRVAASEPRGFEGLDRPVPTRVRIETEDYALDIRILDLKPGPPPEKLFRIDASPSERTP